MNLKKIWPELNQGIYSRSLLLIITLAYFLDIFTGLSLKEIFILDSDLVFENNEFWRLLSYPLAFNNFVSYLLFAFVFTVFAPEVEKLYSKFALPVVTVMILMLHGSLVSLINIDQDLLISGTDGLSFFIIASFLLAYPRVNVEFYTTRKIKVKNLIGLVILIWLNFLIIPGFIYSDFSFITNIELASFGVINGLLLHYQLKLLFNKQTKDIDEPYFAPDDEMVHELAGLDEKTLTENINSDQFILSKNNYENEERMNQLLEKISSNGIDSLSNHERNFLTEYSNYLNK